LICTDIQRTNAVCSVQRW